jgi:hypothetical protein
MPTQSILSVLGLLLKVTSVLPCIAVTILLLLLGEVVARKNPFYRGLVCRPRDARTAHARYATLDGPRGFLALGVFFHHVLVQYFFLLRGKWELPPSRFYAFLGPESVVLFFLLASFLFWSKAMDAAGRLDVPNLCALRRDRSSFSPAALWWRSARPRQASSCGYPSRSYLGTWARGSRWDL